jgi:hypothetical protein
MIHPDDSILLAYARQQPCIEWPGDIQEHVAHCQQCHARCSEYRETGELLEAWAQTQQAYSDHHISGLTERVLRALDEANEPERSLTGHLKRQLRPTSWRFVSLPLALTLVICCTMVIIALAYSRTSSAVRDTNSLRPAQTAAVTYTTSQITPQPTQPLDAAPATTSPGDSGKASPSITICTTEQDEDQHRLRICGFNFTPRTRAALVISTAGGQTRTLPSVPVDAQGRMQATLPVPTCKAIPQTIFAQDTTRPTEVSPVLQNISFGNCIGMGQPTIQPD